MSRNPTSILGGLVAAVLIAGTCRQAEADSLSPAAVELKGPRELGKHVQDITETVLRHHLDPPARQQMVLAGIKGLYEAAGLPIPAGLSRRVSALTTPEQFSALLVELWPARPVKKLGTGGLAEACVNGLLASIPGGAVITSAKEHEVQEQFQGNRYIGIHIQVRYDEKEKRTIIDGIVPGGPADRARMMREDRFEQIDGVDTKDMTLMQVVDRLRGADGTDVSVRVRQPKGEVRTLKATRGPLFIATINGVQRNSSGDWDYHLAGANLIGYLRIREISASTPHELRKVAQQLEGENLGGLIIDLRGLSSTSLHPTVLLADSLLDHGRIGRVREAERVMTYDATPDALFRGWPLVALVDAETGQTAEWLAAALQDNHRAVLVGTATQSGWLQPHQLPGFPGTADLRSTVPVGDGSWYLSLLTVRLERGDGRPLATSPEPRYPLAIIPRRMPERTEQQANGGVKPDHLIGPRNNRPEGQRQNRRGGSFGAEDDTVDPWSDAAMGKAIEVLRAGLKSF
jgi:carboxyl-terminal processing protease